MTVNHENLYSELAEIGPALAKEWLDNYNTHNRPVTQATVDEYARRMLAGMWTMSTIRWSRDGVLLDGQHRLLAVIQSGVTIRAFVERNLDPAWQNDMDTGLKRGAGDVLALNGIDHKSKRIAAAARVAMCMEAEADIDRRRFSNAETLAFVTRNPDLIDAIELMATIGTTPLPASVADYAFYRFSLLDADAAYSFFTKFALGADLERGNPILTLRNRLLGGYGADRKISREEQLSLTFRAWNYWRKGERIFRILSNRHGKKIEIPEPI